MPRCRRVERDLERRPLVRRQVGDQSGCAVGERCSLTDRDEPRAVAVAVDLGHHAVHLLGQTGDQEQHGQAREEQHRQPQHSWLERRGDLPHLGVDEEEDGEDQQQGQRAGHQVEQQAQLPVGARPRPAEDGACLQPPAGPGRAPTPTTVANTASPLETSRLHSPSPIPSASAGTAAIKAIRVSRPGPSRRPTRSCSASTNQGRPCWVNHSYRRDVGIDPVVGVGASVVVLLRFPVHHQPWDTTARTSRQVATSRCICSTRSSTDSNVRVSRSRSTSSNATRSP